MNTFLRIIKFAFQNFFRNIWLSVATVSIILLAVLSVNFLISMNFLVNASLAIVKDKIDVAVYFKKDVSEDKILSVKGELESLESVKDVRYVSRSAALEEFRKRNANRPEALGALDALKENPFLASLVVKAFRPEDYATILQLFDGASLKDLIAEKDFSDYQSLINRIASVSRIIGQVGLGATGVFLFLALMIIFNTIRISIYSHKEEIGIMRLVGASNRFIRWPFLFEGMIYSMIAVALSAGIVFGAATFLDPYLSRFFEGSASLLAFFKQSPIQIFGFQFVGLSLLNMITSGIAMKRYLRV
jgi:cell division transport system permease protein